MKENTNPSHDASPEDDDVNHLLSRLHEGVNNKHIREMMALEDALDEKYQAELDFLNTQIKKLEQQLEQERQRIALAIRALHKAGLDAKAIAQTLDLSEDRVNALL